MSKRLCKICKIEPPYLNFQWLIGPSSIYVPKQQRTKWNHQNNIFLTFQWLCLILYLYKLFLRLGQNLPLSCSLLYGREYSNILIDWNEGNSKFIVSRVTNYCPRRNQGQGQLLASKEQNTCYYRNNQSISDLLFWIAL